jgi:hypothetical protein
MQASGKDSVWEYSAVEGGTTHKAGFAATALVDFCSASGKFSEAELAEIANAQTIFSGGKKYRLPFTANKAKTTFANEIRDWSESSSWGTQWRKELREEFVKRACEIFNAKADDGSFSRDPDAGFLPHHLFNVETITKLHECFVIVEVDKLPNEATICCKRHYASAMHRQVGTSKCWKTVDFPEALTLVEKVAGPVQAPPSSPKVSKDDITWPHIRLLIKVHKHVKDADGRYEEKWRAVVGSPKSGHYATKPQKEASRVLQSLMQLHLARLQKLENSDGIRRYIQIDQINGTTKFMKEVADFIQTMDAPQSMLQSFVQADIANFFPNVDLNDTTIHLHDCVRRVFEFLRSEGLQESIMPVSIKNKKFMGTIVYDDIDRGSDGEEPDFDVVSDDDDDLSSVDSSNPQIPPARAAQAKANATKYKGKTYTHDQSLEVCLRALTPTCVMTGGVLRKQTFGFTIGGCCSSQFSALTVLMAETKFFEEKILDHGPVTSGPFKGMAWNEFMKKNPAKHVIRVVDDLIGLNQFAVALPPPEVYKIKMEVSDAKKEGVYCCQKYRFVENEGRASLIFEAAVKDDVLNYEIVNFPHARSCIPHSYFYSILAGLFAYCMDYASDDESIVNGLMRRIKKLADQGYDRSLFAGLCTRRGIYRRAKNTHGFDAQRLRNIQRKIDEALDNISWKEKSSVRPLWFGASRPQKVSPVTRADSEVQVELQGETNMKPSRVECATETEFTQPSPDLILREEFDAWKKSFNPQSISFHNEGSLCYAATAIQTLLIIFAHSKFEDLRRFVTRSVKGVQVKEEVGVPAWFFRLSGSHDDLVKVSRYVELDPSKHNCHHECFMLLVSKWEIEHILHQSQKNVYCKNCSVPDALGKFLPLRSTEETNVAWRPTRIHGNRKEVNLGTSLFNLFHDPSPSGDLNDSNAKEPIVCDRCKKRVKGHFEVCFLTKINGFLIVHLDRKSQHDGKRLNYIATLPEAFTGRVQQFTHMFDNDLKPTAFTHGPKYTATLLATTKHTEFTAETGHYVFYGKFGGHWHFYDNQHDSDRVKSQPKAPQRHPFADAGANGAAFSDARLIFAVYKVNESDPPPSSQPLASTLPCDDGHDNRPKDESDDDEEPPPLNPSIVAQRNLKANISAERSMAQETAVLDLWDNTEVFGARTPLLFSVASVFFPSVAYLLPRVIMVLVRASDMSSQPAVQADDGPAAVPCPRERSETHDPTTPDEAWLGQHAPSRFIKHVSRNISYSMYSTPPFSSPYQGLYDFFSKYYFFCGSKFTSLMPFHTTPRIFSFHFILLSFPRLLLLYFVEALCSTWTPPKTLRLPMSRHAVARSPSPPRSLQRSGVSPSSHGRLLGSQWSTATSSDRQSSRRQSRRRRKSTRLTSCATE